MSLELPVGPVGTGGDSARTAAAPAPLTLPDGPVGTGGGGATTTTRTTRGGGAAAATITPELLRRADRGAKRHLLLLAGCAAERGWSVRIASWADAASLGDRLYRSKCKRLDDARKDPHGAWLYRYEIIDTPIDQEFWDAIDALPADKEIEVGPMPRRKAPKFPAVKESVTLESAKIARSAIPWLEHERWWMRELRSGKVRLWWK